MAERVNKLELYGIALVVLLAVMAGAYFKGRSNGVDATEDRYAQAALQQAQESAKKEQADRDKLLNVSISYEQQLAQSKIDAASRPARVVRLCDVTATSLPQAPTPTGEPLPQAASESGAGTRFDIGSRLRDYSERYQACAIQVNALIDAWPH